jgi:hypothetical protein
MIFEKLKPNPDNPRIITKAQFEKLLKNLDELPKMLDIHRLAYDSKKDYIVIGGNQRLEGLKVLAKKGLAINDDWFVDIADWTEEEQKQFLITDNLAYGNWNWDILANGWDMEKLEEWGVPVQNLNDLNDAEREWDGMPEFGNTDKSGYKQVLVSFENEEDVQAFAALIGQDIGTNTRYIWYPEHKRQTMIDKEFVAEEK